MADAALGAVGVKADSPQGPRSGALTPASAGSRFWVVGCTQSSMWARSECDRARALARAQGFPRSRSALGGLDTRGALARCGNYRSAVGPRLKSAVLCEVAQTVDHDCRQGALTGGVIAARSLHSMRHAPQRNVSTSGLVGSTRRPESEPQAGQIAGKIIVSSSVVVGRSLLRQPPATPVHPNSGDQFAQRAYASSRPGRA